MKTIQQYKNDYLNQTKTEREEQLKANNQLADNQKKQTQNNYNQKITETGESYEDLYRENEVNRLINQRQIAENMANLGLTDSGLNRTQQTAVQLSYANQKGKIGTEKQKALDSLTSALATAITEIENKRISGQANINNTYAQNANTYAQKMYATDMEAETKRKAQEEKTKQAAYAAKTAQANAKALESQAALKQSSYIIKANGGKLNRELIGSKDLAQAGVTAEKVTKNNNLYWRFTDQNSGFVSDFPVGVNPYTNSMNEDLMVGGKYDESKAFSNGYQPNNFEGNPLKSYAKNAVSIKGSARQTVWRDTVTGKFYAWSGGDNAYAEIKYNKGAWTPV